MDNHPLLEDDCIVYGEIRDIKDEDSFTLGVSNLDEDQNRLSQARKMVRGQFSPITTLKNSRVVMFDPKGKWGVSRGAASTENFYTFTLYVLKKNGPCLTIFQGPPFKILPIWRIPKSKQNEKLGSRVATGAATATASPRIAAAKRVMTDYNTAMPEKRMEFNPALMFRDYYPASPHSSLASPGLLTKVSPPPSPSEIQRMLNSGMQLPQGVTYAPNGGPSGLSPFLMAQRMDARSYQEPQNSAVAAAAEALFGRMPPHGYLGPPPQTGHTSGGVHVPPQGGPSLIPFSNNVWPQPLRSPNGLPPLFFKPVSGGQEWSES